jgi:predicted GIY-YIG superfamily endonuclease
MRNSNQILGQYARMWPRDVFYRLVPKAAKKGEQKKGRGGSKLLFREIDLLKESGVYILYRDDVPYYIGQATKLRLRLREHACAKDSRYYNFWNYFSAFVVKDENHRNQVESILIAAMPTANSAKPRMKKESLPVGVRKMIREIESKRANPNR